MTEEGGKGVFLDDIKCKGFVVRKGITVTEVKPTKGRFYGEWIDPERGRYICNRTFVCMCEFVELNLIQWSSH